MIAAIPPRERSILRVMVECMPQVDDHGNTIDYRRGTPSVAFLAAETGLTATEVEWSLDALQQHGTIRPETVDGRPGWATEVGAWA